MDDFKVEEFEISDEFRPLLYDIITELTHYAKYHPSYQIAELLEGWQKELE